MQFYLFTDLLKQSKSVGAFTTGFNEAFTKIGVSISLPRLVSDWWYTSLKESLGISKWQSDWICWAYGSSSAQSSVVLISWQYCRVHHHILSRTVHKAAYLVLESRKRSLSRPVQCLLSTLLMTSGKEILLPSVISCVHRDIYQTFCAFGASCSWKLCQTTYFIQKLTAATWPLLGLERRRPLLAFLGLMILSFGFRDKQHFQSLDGLKHNLLLDNVFLSECAGFLELVETEPNDSWVIALPQNFPDWNREIWGGLNNVNSDIGYVIVLDENEHFGFGSCKCTTWINDFT